MFNQIGVDNFEPYTHTFSLLKLTSTLLAPLLINKKAQLNAVIVTLLKLASPGCHNCPMLLLG